MSKVKLKDIGVIVGGLLFIFFFGSNYIFPFFFSSNSNKDTGTFFKDAQAIESDYLNTSTFLLSSLTDNMQDKISVEEFSSRIKTSIPKMEDDIKKISNLKQPNDKSIQYQLSELIRESNRELAAYKHMLNSLKNLNQTAYENASDEITEIGTERDNIAKQLFDD